MTWWNGGLALLVAVIGAAGGSLLFRSPRQITRSNLETDLKMWRELDSQTWSQPTQHEKTLADLENLIRSEVDSLRVPGDPRSVRNRRTIGGALLIAAGAVAGAFFIDLETLQQSSLVYTLLLIGAVSCVAALRALLD